MNAIYCPICSKGISVRPAKGRKSGKPFIMLVCPKDARHFRAFVTDKTFVEGVLKEQSARATGTEGSGSPIP